ncbi:enolase-phosphatase E1-like [Mangifera indica]|uniref:enolase-phosphatase E1-like n=1 Tax=Mangifera indica TaxID=29780 RepID=UPI001CF93855|nr:enolase-phosphatase E1-like [Mangifera indica]
MTEEAQDIKTVKKEAHDNMESQIKVAMHSRIAHFKKQADSLTFEGVRRLLEKDLGVETYALDVYKKFIKQCLAECMDDTGDNNASNTSRKAAKPDLSSIKVEGEKILKSCQSTKDIKKEPCSDDAEKMEDSPVLGLLTGNKTPKSEPEETQGHDKEPPSEGAIKMAIIKKAAFIKANSETITMAGLRRLLEEDFKLDKYALDPFKKLISATLDEVLRSDEVPSTVGKNKNVKNNSYNKASKNVISEASSESSEIETREKEDVKPRKKIVSKEKLQNSGWLKKGKRPEKEANVSDKKRIKTTKTVAEDNSDAKESEIVSEDDQSELSAEKPVKKKEVSTPAYGKRVEHLKTVIKSCGMSVPPSIYKKVKQVPENKREAQLIKELEDILSREGLSSNPSEKEIKEVKKKKERARELEGIDMSNIVSSSRRRSTTSFVPPPKPKIPELSDSSDEDSDNDDDSDNVDENNDDADDGSQSEEVNEEEAEDSD